MSDIPDNDKEYVLGFCFEGPEVRNRFVVLIEKQRPDWQQDRFNGVGGHTKVGESPIDAMTREFREETGVVTLPDQWLKFATMSFQNGTAVHCFAMADTTAVASVYSQPGGEPIHVLGREFARTHARCLDNIRWLMEMGLAKLDRPKSPVVTIQYPFHDRVSQIIATH